MNTFSRALPRVFAGLTLSTAALLALGGCGASEQTTPSHTASSKAAEIAAENCSLADIDLRLSAPEGAAGTTYLRVLARNNANKTCTLAGYPQVRALNEQGQPQGTPAQHTPGNITPIKLAPGEEAAATLTVTNPQNYCPQSPVAVSHLELKLPANTAPKLVQVNLEICPVPTETAGMSVEPFLPMQ